jgi:hypothetical protein
MPRLLYCKTCATLEEIPDLGYELAEGEPDPLVEGLLMKHYERDYKGHGGGTGEEQSPFRIPVVDAAEWRDSRAQVIKLINAENKKVGFDAWVYESQNTYSEDAMRCYNDHHRPKEGCIDWWDESKRIGRPTAEGQQAVKDQYKLGDRDPHLCMYCPVASFVQTQVNFKRGLYKDG